MLQAAIEKPLEHWHVMHRVPGIHESFSIPCKLQFDHRWPSDPWPIQLLAHRVRELTGLRASCNLYTGNLEFYRTDPTVGCVVIDIANPAVQNPLDPDVLRGIVYRVKIGRAKVAQKRKWARAQEIEDEKRRQDNLDNRNHELLPHDVDVARHLREKKGMHKKFVKNVVVPGLRDKA